MDKDKEKKEKEKKEILHAVLKNSGLSIFVYYPEMGKLVQYDPEMGILLEIPEYLSYLNTGQSSILEEDRWMVRECILGKLRGAVEIRVWENGVILRKLLHTSLLEKNNGNPAMLIGSIKDITVQKKREENLKNQVQRDAMTMLFNQMYGKQLINEYLSQKNPYDSCGMIVVDIDYFKNVNDSFGHLFGDQVLISFAKLLEMIFDRKDILMRAGGDEFVIFLKDISHKNLLKKAMQLIKAVRRQTFEEADYSMTCSAGVCFLPENSSGYTYDQLFKNADWALYQAKESGRNRYAFCDNLHRFELAEENAGSKYPDIDARYLRNDIVSTAFEIFEKNASFHAALDTLLKVIGIRYQLDRITVIRTDIKGKKVSRQYQWTASGVEQALGSQEEFTKKDFLTLFHSYDENGITVLNYDHMDMYSPQAARTLVQGKAKTVVYAAMYCEGKYVGAISYVVCEQKRFWTKQNLSQLGELTKLISAHLARSQAMNNTSQCITSDSEYDYLTGLLTFTRFREEVERIIVGGYATSHVVVYSDFEGFKFFNQKYGYQVGDQLLKEFSTYLMEGIKDETDVYLARVVSDQFVLFMPYEDMSKAEERIQAVNEEFIRLQAERFPGARIRIRSGVYYVDKNCVSATEAIDAANYARKQMKDNRSVSVKLYTRELDQKQELERKIINEFEKAKEENQFQIYLQPRFSLKDFSIIGAEAVVRWKKEDGTLLYPDDFLPLFEEQGRIVELDFLVFEQVAAFLEKNQLAGRRQVPISVNVSVAHALEEKAVDQYYKILQSHGVAPEMTEMELSEKATVSDYDNVCKLFQQFQDLHMLTSLDDFGSSYSALSTVLNISLNTVKLDKKLLSKCMESQKGVYFLEELVKMLKGLGYHAVCEGVETKEQVVLLQKIGCEEAQGYWFAYPLTIEEYEQRMYGAKKG